MLANRKVLCTIGDVNIRIIQGHMARRKVHKSRPLIEILEAEREPHLSVGNVVPPQKGHLVKDYIVSKVTNFGDTRACFNCGQSGHLASDCTRTASSASTGVGYCLSISTPITDCVIIEEVYRGSMLQLGDKEMVADLLPLRMLDFDFILGMDRLASYHATVDCYRKEVVFSNFGEPEFRFCGDRCASPSYVISVITAREMLKKGCQGYLAYVVDSELSGLRLEDIPIVRDFVDIFPDELPGLPPDREIEFAIDLIPGNTPISSAPYRMAPEELKELKMQLQELLDKG
ncbi:uncharacterized protein LOC114306459 [Camellia sinensis]|uniref:uncharacterized protein LOC114306459 n=1 Tax=Camellia sinensis TaxID=4442 RepID=UPI0010360D39|nr:uncharacterized protein LOC114306459 [Camellia sinensis]